MNRKIIVELAIGPDVDNSDDPAQEVYSRLMYAARAAKASMEQHGNAFHAPHQDPVYDMEGNECGTLTFTHQ